MCYYRCDPKMGYHVATCSQATSTDHVDFVAAFEAVFGVPMDSVPPITRDVALYAPDVDYDDVL